MESIVLYLLTGVISGVLAGLLGIGGGLVIVPALVYILDFDSAYIMHISVGTSLAVVTLTALSSARAHHLKGTVRWNLWRVLAPGLAIGTLVGAAIADHLDGSSLRLFFAGFELLVAVQLTLGIKSKPSTTIPGSAVVFSLSFLIGIVCAFAGVGGGIMIVPLLMWMHLSIKEAVSTSAACGAPIAIAGTIGFMLIGMDVAAELPAMSTGFIYWPAFIAIAIPSVLFAPLGAKLAHALPSDVLKKVFSVFLVVVAIAMFLS